MDKFKAFLSDKKNTPIVGAVAGIVLVLVILFYLKQFGVIGGGGGAEQYTDTSMTDQTATGTTTPTDGSATGTTPSGTATTPDMSATGTGATTGTGAATGATTASAPAAPVDKIPPMFAYRKDPFMGFSGPPKKEYKLMALLPSIRHIRLAPATVWPGPAGAGPVEEALPPQPMRRVAGIMWGSTVKAIIESGGKTYVVVPGQQIPEERVRVESIEPSGVILTTLDTRRPMKIRVNLAGSPAAQEQANAENMNTETPPPGNSGRGSRGGGGPVETPPPGF